MSVSLSSSWRFLNFSIFLSKDIYYDLYDSIGFLIIIELTIDFVYAFN